ncbi:hypothetical protein GW17_00008233 [Ensete ventricosum]|nr:hypothetical protein GW17_00008233 [Ensete ventricosum]
MCIRLLLLILSYPLNVWWQAHLNIHLFHLQVRSCQQMVVKAVVADVLYCLLCHCAPQQAWRTYPDVCSKGRNASFLEDEHGWWGWELQDSEAIDSPRTLFCCPLCLLRTQAKGGRWDEASAVVCTWRANLGLCGWDRVWWTSPSTSFVSLTPWVGFPPVWKNTPFFLLLSFWIGFTEPKSTAQSWRRSRLDAMPSPTNLTFHTTQSLIGREGGKIDTMSSVYGQRCIPAARPLIVKVDPSLVQASHRGFPWTTHPLIYPDKALIRYLGEGAHHIRMVHDLSSGAEQLRGRGGWVWITIGRDQRGQTGDVGGASNLVADGDVSSIRPNTLGARDEIVSIEPAMRPIGRHVTVRTGV